MVDVGACDNIKLKEIDEFLNLTDNDGHRERLLRRQVQPSTSMPNKIL